MSISCFIRGWIKKFWNYSHISIIIRRNYIKLIQSPKLPFPYFAMMFEWRSKHADIRRHHLMTSCNSDPAKILTEIAYPKKEQTPTFMLHLAIIVFRLKWFWLGIIGINNSRYAILNFLDALTTERKHIIEEYQKKCMVSLHSIIKINLAGWFTEGIV